jgi:methionine synthase / methylenetetrahydrofolate reductase(NADPH)
VNAEINSPLGRGKFRDLLQTAKKPILSDGAMGTVLNSRGIAFNHCFDELNLTDPELVAGIHQAYIQAGSDIIQTNTFGANRYKLASHGLEDRIIQINQAGVELARGVVVSSGRDVLVAGDIGPLGVRLAPFGRVQTEQARQAFREQISALVLAGVDLLIIETISDIFEIEAAISAARDVSGLPVVASMTFTRDDRTLLGDLPAQVAQKIWELGADVIGINCSGGPAQIYRILQQMQSALPNARFSVMPNAGWPEQVGGRVMYPANPQYFGNYVHVFCQAGVQLVGGCCGTTPEHIAAMRQALDLAQEGCLDLPRESISISEQDESLASPESATRLSEKLSSGGFVVAVEMDPPRGASTHKILAGASLLSEVGADVINVADSPMARMRMSPWAICGLLQRELGVESTLHFPTRGRNLLRVQGDLLAAHALNIRNVFVVMGDPTSIGDYPDAMDNYDLVPSGLIRLIKQNFNAGLDHAGADIGQPTSFFVGGALNMLPVDMEREIKNLHRKVQAGVDFLLSQPVFQPSLAEYFIKCYQDRYGRLEIPILVGVLPLYNPRHATFLHNEVPGIQISAEYLERILGSGERSPQEGIRIALELIEQIKPWASGIYLMPAFNRYEVAAEIIDELQSLL